MLVLVFSLTACRLGPNPATSQGNDAATADSAQVEESAPVTPSASFNEPISPISPLPTVSSSSLPTVEPAVEGEPTRVVTPVTDLAEETITVESSGGTEVSGTLFGQDDTLVIILPAPGETEDAWFNQAKTIAAQGFMVLTLDLAALSTPATLVDYETELDYIQSAIAMATERDAVDHILVGSGERGVVAIKAAGETGAKAVVTFSTPLSSGDLNLTVEDLQAIDGAKLFIDSDGSPTQPAAMQMFDWSSNPKTWRFMEGNAQGAAMYDMDYAMNLTDFIAAFFLLRLS
jgi:hypothetical protein